MNALLATTGLRAGYGRVAAVHGIDIEVRAGEVVSLLGPNGAGKSTTLLTVAGVLAPLGGTVEILGEQVTRPAPHRVARLGLVLVPEGRGLFRSMTVAENFRLRTRKGAGSGVDRVLDLFPPLRPLLGRRAGVLSGGEQQMVAIGGALLQEPKMIMLDELSLGLAPVVVERLLPVVRDIADEAGVGVLLVEQHVSAALEIADRGYIMVDGRIVQSGEAAALRKAGAAIEAAYLGEGSVREAEAS